MRVEYRESKEPLTPHINIQLERLGSNQGEGIWFENRTNSLEIPLTAGGLFLLDPFGRVFSIGGQCDDRKKALNKLGFRGVAQVTVSHEDDPYSLLGRIAIALPSRNQVYVSGVEEEVGVKTVVLPSGKLTVVWGAFHGQSKAREQLRFASEDESRRYADCQ